MILQTLDCVFDLKKSVWIDEAIVPVYPTTYLTRKSDIWMYPPTITPFKRNNLLKFSLKYHPCAICVGQVFARPATTDEQIEMRLARFSQLLCGV